KKRLERGRDLLRERLVRRGLGPTAMLVAAAWPGAASAILPAPLVRATALAGAMFAAGGGEGKIAVSAQVLALVEGVSRAVIPSAWKLALVTTLVVGVACLAAATFGGIEKHNHPTVPPLPVAALQAGQEAGNP